MVAIVGHGPSMLSATHGAEIDRHDIVIRQKRCQETLKHPRHYGSKTDIVCGSWTIARTLPDAMPDCKYWVFLDSRHSNVSDAEVAELAETLPCRIEPALCRHWNGVYRKRRQPYTCPPGVQSFGDPLGHPHLSAGLHCLIYACALLRPEKITLYGFDNVCSGTFTWSITRGPDWARYPDHNWPTEHDMVPMISGKYGVEICYR